MSDVQSSRWIQLDPSKYEQDQPVSVRGVEFHVLVSPYDMPEAVRGRYDAANRCFVIEFRYIMDEATKPQRVDEHVVLRVGERTQRLYKIEVNVDEMAAKEVVLHLKQAIERLPSALEKRELRRPNFDIANRAIHVHQAELLNAVAR